MSGAIGEWAKKTREWLDNSLGEGWTRQQAMESEARQVNKTKSLKSADAGSPFLPIYPYHVNSGYIDNRVKVRRGGGGSCRGVWAVVWAWSNDHCVACNALHVVAQGAARTWHCHCVHRTH